MSRMIRIAAATAGASIVLLGTAAGTALAADGSLGYAPQNTGGALAEVQPALAPAVKLVHAQVQPNVNVLSPAPGNSPVNAR